MCSSRPARPYLTLIKPIRSERPDCIGLCIAADFTAEQQITAG
jgi:hypothetical protein